MKTALVLLLSAACALPVLAVEYVTLTPNSATKAVSTTDLVEVVGTTMNNNGEASALQFTFPGNEQVQMVLRGKEASAFDDMKGNAFIGLTNIQLLTQNNNEPIAVTLKITSAEERSVAAPGTVLVVPESTEGDLTVLVESSNDMVNWSGFLSQNITAGSSPQFYRTRIIKTVSP